MAESRGLHILLFPHRLYPCDHALLASVYSRHLPARGHRVSWIMQTADPNGTRSTVDWNGTDVHLIGPAPRPGAVHRRVHELKSKHAGRETARALCAGGRVDVIQVRNELCFAEVAIAIKKQHGVPFVFQRSFPLPALALAEGERRGGIRAVRGALLSRIYAAREMRVMRQADLVLAVSDAMCDDLLRRGLGASRVRVLPLGVDPDVSAGAHQGAAIRAELGLSNRPVVLYFGALDRVRRLDVLLQTMIRVRAAVPDVVLLMLGSAVDEGDVRWLRRRAREAGSDLVRFLQRVPRPHVPRYLAAADVSVSPIPPIPLYTVSSPTKALESLGMGVPVVANEEIPDQRHVIEQSGGGICVSYAVDSFAAAITSLLSNPERARAMGACGRSWAVRNRSYERLASLVEQWYGELLAVR